METLHNKQGETLHNKQGEILHIRQGEILHKAGDVVTSLDYLESGRFEIKNDTLSIILKKGSILGLFEQPESVYTFDYVATEDCTLHAYPYTTKSDINKIVSANFSNCDQLITVNAGLVVSIASKYRMLQGNSDAFCRCIENAYSEYRELCEIYHIDIQTLPFIETFKPFAPEEDIPDWLNDYYDQLEIMPKQIKQNFFGSHTSLGTAAIIEAGDYFCLYLRTCNQLNTYSQQLISRFFDVASGDIYDLYYNLLMKADSQSIKNGLAEDVRNNIRRFTENIKSNPLVPGDKLAKMAGRHTYDISEKKMAADSDSQNIYSNINHSLDIILNYTNFDEAEAERFRKLIKQYLNARDKNSSDSELVQLRQDISKSFFDIYEAAVISSMDAVNIPVVLKMFFYFGYIDENLIGKDNALKLYDMAEKINYDGSNNVYTVYEWLKSIYKGKNDPSKNEYDQDFPTFIKSQRQSGIISEDMEKRYLNSPKEKMRFEIMNLFRNCVKISSGRPSIFCPVLSEHNVIIPLEKILATADKIVSNWNLIKAIDYTCFYREANYKNDEFKIARETIQVQVLPNTILMPCIGTRAGLWQETCGVRRDTPARMFLPIFSNEDLLSLQIKLAAEFRWEICKRIQGARWNDFTSHSLTSEYFDYLQFYKKNTNLTSEAKAKIKSSLLTCKNSFKNVFVADYIVWIRYESQGSPRLNKVARNILAEFCPFSRNIRNELKAHPMYTDYITRHEMKIAKNYKTLGNYYNKFRNNKGELPLVINDYINLYTL